MPVVSVVVPVWNSEPFLQQCLESVLGQTFGDWELICVDDGSSDGSTELVCSIAETEPRLRLIRQLHAGAGVARNRGIASAVGTFVYCLDSDDYIAPDTLERLVTRAEESRADVVFFESVYAGREEQTRRSGIRRRQRKLAGRVWQGPEYMEPALKAKVFRYSPCLQFIRRSLITENGLRYPALRMAEDGVFTVHLCLSARRVAYLPETLFYRRWRAGSVTTGARPLEAVRGTLTALRLIPRTAEGGTHAASATRALRRIRRRHWRYALHQWDKLPAVVRKTITPEAILEEDEDLSTRFLRAARIRKLERRLSRMIHHRRTRLPEFPLPAQ